MGRNVCRICVLLLVLLTAAFVVQSEESTVIGSYETTCIRCGADVTGEMDLYRHWYRCAQCQNSSSATHQNYCSDLTVCITCSATGIVIDPEYIWQQYHENVICTYVDTKYCQYGCTVCGYRYGMTEHYLFCDNPDFCADCGAGASMLDVKYSHHFYQQPWVNMGDYHQQTCRDCDEFRTDEHYGDCCDPDYCRGCKTDGVMINERELNHPDIDYVDLGLTHQLVCPDCGKAEMEEAHYVSCLNPDYCKDCGARGLDIPQDKLYHGGTIIQSQGDNYHEEVCQFCGYVKMIQEHWAYCAERTVCVDCGQTGLSLMQKQIVHNNYEYENLGDSHCLVCSDCGLDKTEIHTVYCTAPSVCEECGAVGLNMSEDILKHKSTHYEKLDELYHQEVCEDCGDRTPSSREEAGYRYQHQTECFDKTQTCYICHAPNVEIPEFDQDHVMKFIDLGELHQEICTLCDYSLEPSRHKAACTNPTVCEFCGLIGLKIAEEDLNHATSAMSFVSVGEKHQMICARCDWKSEPASHSVNCDDLTTCKYCGQTGMKIPVQELELWHIYPRELVENLGTEHRIRCVCGENVETELHDVSCIAPNVCRFCDADNVVMPPELQSHSGHSVNLGLQHQYFCDYCDYFEQPEDHKVYCTIPEQCNDCFVTLLDYPLELFLHPDYALTYENLGDHHRRGCSECGAAELLEHQYGAYNSCKCGSRLAELSGDVNADGMVNVMDVPPLLEHLSGIDVFISMTNSDVNDDFERDETDLLLLMQYLSGWNVALQ